MISLYPYNYYAQYTVCSSLTHRKVLVDPAEILRPGLITTHALLVSVLGLHDKS